MIATSIGECGYQVVPAIEMRAELEQVGRLSDWPEFAASWNDLRVDPYLVDGARFRKRRFGVFDADSAGHVWRQPHQPHFQHRDYNKLFGGIERWFEPIATEIASGQTLQTIVRFCARCFGGLAPDVARWRVEVHQFRIEARSDAPGQPTPEGVHRDGVDYVLVLLVARANIADGVTSVYDRDGRVLGSFTLADPFDATLVDDNRVAHGVTPVAPVDPSLPAHRDVLVVTFRRSNPEAA
jgi:hypothetical protein